MVHLAEIAKPCTMLDITRHCNVMLFVMVKLTILGHTASLGTSGKMKKGSEGEVGQRRAVLGGLGCTVCR